MSDELKPCPFCGNEPAPYWKGVGCATSGCLLNGLHLDADKWNRRAQPAEAEGVDVVAYADPKAFENFKTLGSKGGVHGHEWMWAKPDGGLVGMVREDAHLAALSAVTAERDRLREDAERISFIEREWFYSPSSDSWSFSYREDWEESGATLRDAIDAAMARKDENKTKNRG